MRVKGFLITAANLLLAVPSAARISWVQQNEQSPPRPKDDDVTRLKGPAHEGTFQQLIDHEKPELGTFSQRYWYNAEYYAGPGSPVVLKAPNEQEGNPLHASKDVLPGMLAQTNGGAVIVLEHRYWGKSSPYDSLTTTNLQYLNLNNAIQDLIYFAHNVKLPFDVDGTSKPTKAPWLLTGCSYSGALAAWTHHLAPGTFWAYHCSSAVVEAISDFWRFNEPIREAMPKNCTADMRLAIQHIDSILSNGTAGQKHTLKKKFGLESLRYDDDFSMALIGGLQQWQNTIFYKLKRPNKLYQFCDYLENMFPDNNTRNNSSDAVVPGPEGVGTCKAMEGFARWSKEVYLPGACAAYNYWKEGNSTECLDSHDQNNPLYKDLSVDNTINRQWYWLLCNEPLEWWQFSGPDDTTGLVPKMLGVEYGRRLCRSLFPRDGNHTYGLALGRTVGLVNQKTGGWSRVNTTRLMWVNGEHDPWRSATVSAHARPGGPLKTTPEAPVWVVPKAAHCNDWIARNADANPELRRIVDAILATMKKWVDEYYEENDRKPLPRQSLV